MVWSDVFLLRIAFVIAAESSMMVRLRGVGFCEELVEESLLCLRDTSFG
jgi:hypothetical protein